MRTPDSGWRRADQAMALLWRLVTADDWSPDAAAREFQRRVEDPKVVCQVAARVRRAVVERRSEFGARAELTVEAALAGTS
jgi:hypothetical protein